MTILFLYMAKTRHSEGIYRKTTTKSHSRTKFIHIKIFSSSLLIFSSCIIFFDSTLNSFGSKASSQEFCVKLVLTFFFFFFHPSPLCSLSHTLLTRLRYILLFLLTFLFYIPFLRLRSLANSFLSVGFQLFSLLFSSTVNFASSARMLFDRRSYIYPHERWWGFFTRNKKKLKIHTHALLLQRRPRTWAFKPLLLLAWNRLEFPQLSSSTLQFSSAVLRIRWFCHSPRHT